MIIYVFVLFFFTILAIIFNITIIIKFYIINFVIATTFLIMGGIYSLILFIAQFFTKKEIF